MIAEVGPAGLPRVAIIHHHPGRLRLRGSALVRSAAFAERVRDALDEVPGVRHVGHNAASGSVVIDYEPDAVDADALLGRLLEAGIRLEDRRRRPDAPRAVVGAARGLNARVAAATGGATDLHGVVSFALGVGAVASLVLARGTRVPRWDNLLYWSYAFFRDVHVRDVERSTRRAAR